MFKNFLIAVGLTIGFRSILSKVLSTGFICYWNMTSMFETSMDIIKVDTYIAGGAANIWKGETNVQ